MIYGGCSICYNFSLLFFSFFAYLQRLSHKSLRTARSHHQRAVSDYPHTQLCSVTQYALKEHETSSLHKTADEIWRVLLEHVDRPLQAMRCWGECTVEKEGNEVQHLEAHRGVGEEYIFRMRQGGTVYSEYNNDSSLGKSTCVLIDVWNKGK